MEKASGTEKGTLYEHTFYTCRQRIWRLTLASLSMLYSLMLVAVRRVFCYIASLLVAQLCRQKRPKAETSLWPNSIRRRRHHPLFTLSESAECKSHPVSGLPLSGYRRCKGFCFAKSDAKNRG